MRGAQGGWAHMIWISLERQWDERMVGSVSRTCPGGSSEGRSGKGGLVRVWGQEQGGLWAGHRLFGAEYGIEGCGSLRDVDRDGGPVYSRTS